MTNNGLRRRSLSCSAMLIFRAQLPCGTCKYVLYLETTPTEQLLESKTGPRLESFNTVGGRTSEVLRRQPNNEASTLWRTTSLVKHDSSTPSIAFLGLFDILNWGERNAVMLGNVVKMPWKLRQILGTNINRHFSSENIKKMLVKDNCHFQ
jgi:hypothetical protein